jgi:hypothetical protein
MEGGEEEGYFPAYLVEVVESFAATGQRVPSAPRPPEAPLEEQQEEEEEEEELAASAGPESLGGSVDAPQDAGSGAGRGLKKAAKADHPAAAIQAEAAAALAQELAEGEPAVSILETVHVD